MAKPTSCTTENVCVLLVVCLIICGIHYCTCTYNSYDDAQMCNAPTREAAAAGAGVFRSQPSMSSNISKVETDDAASPPPTEKSAADDEVYREMEYWFTDEGHGETEQQMLQFGDSASATQRLLRRKPLDNPSHRTVSHTKNLGEINPLLQILKTCSGSSNQPTRDECPVAFGANDMYHEWRATTAA